MDFHILVLLKDMICMSYFFINLNLFIIGNSLASPLHTLTIPIIAYITPNTFNTVRRIVFRNPNGNNIKEFIIDMIRLKIINIINKFIP